MNTDAGKIRQALQNPLPGKVSHYKMLPLNRQLKPADDEDYQLKHSSVLLLIYREKDELFTLLIKRPAHMKHHAGQIALPGGRIEKDETALETAIRETSEEIGLTASQIDILGNLSDIYVQVSQFLIHPFVGWINSTSGICIDRNEVEKTIAFPLKLLRNKIEEVEIQTRTGWLQVPCIPFGDEIIWGATAMILMELNDILQQQPEFN